MVEPRVKRVYVYVDGQNLFRAAMDAYGKIHPYIFPSYDVRKLGITICESRKNWSLMMVRFYSGIPDVNIDPEWHSFWVKKLAHMGRLGVKTFSRQLRYSPEGKPREKGVDVRLAIDLIRDAHKNLYDVAVIFSQDQDLSEAAAEIRPIANEQKRWIRVASAFPVFNEHANRRGIDKTDWIPVDKATYDACLDPRDYR